MSDKQDALFEISGLIRQHGLTMEDVAAALAGTSTSKAEKSSAILTQIFGYIGGIFVFAGLATFIGMHWDTIAPAGRIMLTLGVGFSLFLMAVSMARDGRFERAATPLFMTAALLEPAGIIVTLKEYARSGDPAHGLLFMAFVMALQQGLIFYALRRSFLAFTTIFFSLSMFVTAFSIMHIPETLAGIITGISLTCLAWTLGNSRHRKISGITYFVGSALLLCSAWDWLQNTRGEILFLGLSCGLIFISTLARSRTLLTMGTIATISYIGYFTARHFAHEEAWPFILMLMGFVLIGMSVLAVKLNRKYISQK